MSQLDAIKKRLLDLAEKSDDTETIVKSVQAANAIKADRASWPSVLTLLTPTLSVLLTGLTLLINNYQTNQRTLFEREQAEESEWRDVLKNVSIENPGSVQMGLFSLQGFFDSRSRHAPEARSIAVALLPLASNEDGFDIIFTQLQRQTSDSNQEDLLTIGRTVSSRERDLMVRAVSERPALRASCQKVYPDLYFAKEDCFTDNSDLDSPVVDHIWLYSWEIGSVSDGLLKLWTGPNRRANPKAKNLSGIIFEDGNFDGIDFTGANLDSTIINHSRLPHAHLDKTSLRNATFRALQDYKDATWDQADWWDAASLPCDLAAYLNFTYPPADKDARTSAEKLTARCTRN